MINYLLVFAFIVFLSGCGNKNIIMPGQESSDCEIADDNNGVCGLPLDLYKYRSKIQQLKAHPGVIYSIDDKGVIRNKETREIIDYNSGNINDEVSLNSFSSKHINGNKFNMKKKILLRNNSLIIQHPTKMTHIRDLGYVQKIWIAPHENSNGTLVSAYDIFVVIKKPKWIVGEEKPKSINNGRSVPSLIAIDMITNNHSIVKNKDSEFINNYLSDTKIRNVDDINIINEYLKKNKKMKDLK